LNTFLTAWTSSNCTLFDIANLNLEEALALQEGQKTKASDVYSAEDASHFL